MSNLLERTKAYDKALSYYNRNYRTAVEHTPKYHSYYFNSNLVYLKQIIEDSSNVNGLTVNQQISLLLIFMNVSKEEIIKMSKEEQLAYIYLFRD